MARTETVENIILQAKERADMENNAFISDASWLRLLNIWSCKLHNKLAHVNPERYMREQFLIFNGTYKEFPVPDDYLGTMSVEYSKESNAGSAPSEFPGFPDIEPWDIWNNPDLNSNFEFISTSRFTSLPFLTNKDELDYTGTDNTDFPGGYTFRYNPEEVGSELLRVLPSSLTSTVLVRHRYIVTAPVLTESSIVRVVSGFEDYIIIGMAIDARIKEESDVSQLRRNLQMMDEQITKSAELRNLGDAGRINESRSKELTDLERFNRSTEWYR